MKIKNIILLFVLVPLMALAQVNETWRANTFTLPGLGVLTKAELYRLQGVTSNVQSQINSNSSRITTLESYDKVLEYANVGVFPGTGATTTLYVAKATNKLYRWDGSAYQLLGDGTNTGDIVGPASATDTALAIFDGVTGKLLKNSVITLNSTGTLSTTSGNNLTITTANSADSVIVPRNIRHQALVSNNFANDTATGSNQTLSAPTTRNVRLTAAGTLVSVDGIPAGLVGQQLMIVNQTGAQVTFNNETGATAANRIVTGTGASIKIRDKGSIQLTYDTATSRWHVTGGVGGSSGLGDTDTMFVQDFEGAVAGDFTISGGWSLNTSSALHGDVDMRVTHATATTTYSVKQSLTVPPKFRGKNNTIKITTKSGATSGNVVLDAGCTTDTDLLNGQTIQIDSGTGGKEHTSSFDVPSTCTAMTWTIRALPETGPPTSIIDDVSIYLTKVVGVSALTQQPDSRVYAAGNAGQSITAVVTDVPFILSTNIGSGITFNGSTFSVSENGLYSINGAIRQASATTQKVYLYENGVLMRSAIGYSGATASLLTPFNSELYLTSGNSYSIRLDNNATLTNLADHFIEISHYGSVKQANVNSNQKIKIPVSELRFEGATSRGSTNTGIVVFSNLTKLTGDAFDINPMGTDTTLGTHIKMKKSGILHATANLYTGSSGGYIYVTKNSTVLGTSNPATSDVMCDNGLSLASTSPYFNASCTFPVVVGDIIRVNSGNNPAADFTNSFKLTFQEQDIQVSVSNTLPQWTENDIILRAQGNAGTSVTADVTDIPFTTITVDSNSKFTSNTTYTIPESGAYTIDVGVVFTTANGRTLGVYVNGSLAQYIGSGASASNHQGSLTLNFTAGQLVSIRSSVGGTLSNITTAHYLNITKRGKGNVSGIDVTPFVTIPGTDYQQLEMNNVSYSGGGGATISGALTGNTGTALDIISYNSSTGLFTVLRKAEVDINVSLRASAAGTVAPYINIGALSVTADNSPAVASQWASSSYHATLDVGQTIQAGNNSAGASSAVLLTVYAKAASTQIVTPVESFSTDSATLVQKTTALTSSDPIGTFVAYSFLTGSSSAKTVCATAPTQSISDMQVNGFFVTAKNYTATQSCALPSAFSIQIGKGYKGWRTFTYFNTGKTTPLTTGFFSYSTAESGLIETYDATTGILTIDAGSAFSGSAVRYIGQDNNGTTTYGSKTTGYVSIQASKTPTLSGISYVAPRVAYLSDVKASGTAGGTCTAGSYATRTLNTEDDQSDFLTLSGNQFTLPSGEYIIEGSAPAFRVDNHKAKIRNITDAADALLGTTNYSTAGTSTSGDSRSFINGRLVITSSKTFELQHRCTTTLATQGLGVASVYGDNEVYSQLKITKVK